MTSLTASSVNIQTTSQAVPSTPSWCGEITVLAHHLQRQDVLTAIEEQVHFARRRFGRYEVIDCVAVRIALCSQWRTNARSLLRVPPALGKHAHGALRTRSFASPFDP
jgi:hypothetical protein